MPHIDVASIPGILMIVRHMARRIALSLICIHVLLVVLSSTVMVRFEARKNTVDVALIAAQVDRLPEGPRERAREALDPALVLESARIVSPERSLARISPASILVASRMVTALRARGPPRA
jgi:hypothetical protein